MVLFNSEELTANTRKGCMCNRQRLGANSGISCVCFADLCYSRRVVSLTLRYRGPQLRYIQQTLLF